MNLIEGKNHQNRIKQKCQWAEEENYSKGWAIDDGACIPIKEETATGRATCRFCGNKITKGTQCWSFGYDWQGCGSYTTQKVYIHKEC